jgi:hypothetical protein
MLLIGDWLCYQITLPVTIDEYNGITILQVGSQVLSLGAIGTPATLQFAPHDPVVHEYQLDGTDSTNNFTLDTTYLHAISSSPYYQFQAWMRDLDGTSRWYNAQIWNNSHLQQNIPWPSNGLSISLPGTKAERFTVELQRPETPMTLNLTTAQGSSFSITLDRNDRSITVTRVGDSQSLVKTFFPVDPLPFAAMVVDFLLRTMIWAIVLLLVVFIGKTALTLCLLAWDLRRQDITECVSMIDHSGSHSRTVLFHPKALHPIAFVALGASLIFTSGIALVEYHAEPHIFDAAAYFFTAKMYAQGQLWLPIPPASDRFPGPFMVQYAGRWFAQYSPGTALTLVPGIWLGIPWLVEPLLGTLALLGIGLIAARLYDWRVATLAVILGTLSPFYSYLAASYMSHTVALFYLVWGIWALLRFAQGEAGWNLPLAAALFGMGIMTRDQVALLFVVIVLPGILLLHWRQFQKREYWRRWFISGAAFLMVALLFAGLSLGYNKLLTGSPLVTPRSLFFAGDHWGFGQGIGFYGQHTLAAGFVNFDELLTILAIDLFGWPFYFTLAFIALPFLVRRAIAADWLLLACAAIMTGAFIGYFYHGIYLGPRYLYETLPFLLILTARGILTLATIEKLASLSMKVRQSYISVLIVLCLITCNLFYYLPRQTQIYHNYAGLPAHTPLDVAALYHPLLHSAIVVTDNYVLYQIDLFPLNDPLLHNDVIYAFASTPTDYEELARAFPTRTLYRLNIQPDGSISYTAIGNYYAPGGGSRTPLMSF